MMEPSSPTFALVVFWVAFAEVGYAYLGYPILLIFAARLCGTRPAPPVVAEIDLPSVTLLIVANNEEAVIAARLENALAIDYPRERFEIVVASDGSIDDTEAIVQTFSSRGVRLEAVSPRQGKTAMLNRVITKLRSDVIVLSDGNTLTEPDSVRKLARWFVDTSIGVVCGKLKLVDHVTGHNVDGLYWRIETAMKEREAQLGAIIGANGAIYALRRSVFVPIPPDTIVDDLVVPLRARIVTDCRLLFDREAVAIEETAPHVEVEFRRRVRIGTGGFQAIALLWPLLNPRRGWIAVTFLSHKVLRWLCPFFMIALLAANFPLADDPFYRLFLAAQVSFHLTATLFIRSDAWGRLPRLVRLGLMFHSMNVALLVGFWNWLRGGQSGGWQRTERVGERVSARIIQAAPPDRRP
jgi:cellulose synthase/poly-beta-1,6-N-acetylglucosamine synthase-like glycosyltransferase